MAEWSASKLTDRLLDSEISRFRLRVVFVFLSCLSRT